MYDMYVGKEGTCVAPFVGSALGYNRGGDSGRTVLLYYGMYNVLIKMILASRCLLLTSPRAGRHKCVCMYIHIWCNNVTMQEL